MTSSSDSRARKDGLPPALASMWRLCKLGYQHEPGLIVTAFTLALVAALPDALLAFWFKLLGEGVLGRDWALVAIRAAGARRVGHGDLVPANGQHPHPAPVPRQGDDCARVARGDGCWRRFPRSPTRNGPTISIGSRCCATRCSCWITCTCRSSRHADGSCVSPSRSPAGFHSPRAWPAGVLCAAAGGDVDVAARCRATCLRARRRSRPVWPATCSTSRQPPRRARKSASLASAIA